MRLYHATCITKQYYRWIVTDYLKGDLLQVPHYMSASQGLSQRTTIFDYRMC